MAYHVEVTVIACSKCGQPIDVWHDPDLSLVLDVRTGDGHLTMGDLAAALCAGCTIRQLPDRQRHIASVMYEGSRHIRRLIGPQMGTLFEFPFLGEIAHHDVTVYALNVNRWDDAFPQPQITLVPDDPSEGPSVFVWFAVMIARQALPTAALQLWWQFNHPKVPARLEVIGWEDPQLTEPALNQLLKGTEIFRPFPRTVKAGRPAGSYKRSRRWYTDAYRSQARNLARPPSQAEFAEANEVSIQTVRKNLKSYGFASWDDFVSQVTGAVTKRWNK